MRILKILISGIILASLMTGSAFAAALNGAGATFPYPIYMKWNSEYNRATGVKVNYQGIGSGGGIRQFIAGTTDFGGTDSIMTSDEMSQAGGDVQHIPTVMGAVAVCYNLKGVTSLKLDPATLVSIFRGDIKKWNSPAIAKLNPGVNLPDKNILIAHRSDGSGTTDIFTTYLAKVSLGWATKVGRGKALKWPTGVGGKGNAGVAGIVKVNDGAIGYVELSYAITNSLPVVALKNKAGNFVAPSIDSTSAAAAGALLDPKMSAMIDEGDFRLDLTNAPGANSYPIVGLTWIIVSGRQKNKDKGEALKAYLKWAVTVGQKYAPELLYAPLPADVQKKVTSVIDSIKI